MSIGHDGIRRVRRSRQQARRTYDGLSRVYDVLAGASERRFKQAAVRLLAAQPGERILEIGVGTGADLLPLGQVSALALGVDLSMGMLAVSRRKLIRAGGGDRIRLTCADAAHLPVGPGSFDGVYMAFTLELFDTPEIPLVLAECRRALVAGGRLCVLALSRHSPNLATRVYEWAHERFPAAIDCRPILAEHAVRGVGFRILDVRTDSLMGLATETVLAARSG
jgi:ubiquinone/menaquinone biosynthesis C-methylase UbiE